MPAGSAVCFYAPFADVIPDQAGTALLAQLRSGGDPTPVQRIAAGQYTADMAFWGQPDDPRVGIFPSDGSIAPAPLAQLPPTQPLFLSQLLRLFPGAELHCVCGRTITDVNRARVLSTPPEFFPAKPASA